MVVKAKRLSSVSCGSTSRTQLRGLGFRVTQDKAWGLSFSGSGECFARSHTAGSRHAALSEPKTFIKTEEV